jgi:catechol 2,3-dioxygenase-like lactoylglutathione lyase family enzyme
MQFHRGRLFDHVHLRVSNVETSKRFYKAVLKSLGLSDVLLERPHSFQADELFVDKADGPVSRVHLAFLASSREIVSAFYQAAIDAGGRDNGAPGERTYHPGYFAAFVFDPDGNNVEAVFHGPAKRSAPSVVFTPEQ